MPGPITRRRVLIAALILSLSAAGLVVLIWRQEVGNRFAPLPTAIPAGTLTEISPTVERRDAQGIQQVWVPPGWFRRGSDPRRDFWYARADETPQHDVHITRGFWLDKYEVTNASFAAFVAAGAYERPELWREQGWQWKGARRTPARPVEPGFEDSDQPRSWITWFEAEAYARWRGGRLPTEAEWEYAARGPASSIYPWGDEWDDARAHTSESGLWQTRPVGSFLRGVSWCGAHDLCGNVHEWTADWFDPLGYRFAPCADPSGPESGRARSLRGGSFGGPRSSARSARRMDRDPTQPSLAIGIRVVTDSATPAPDKSR